MGQQRVHGGRERGCRFRNLRRGAHELAVCDHRAPRIDPPRADAVRGERRGNDAAADELAFGGDGIEPARRHLAQHAQRADDPFELVEFGVEKSLDRRPLDRRRDHAGDVEVARAQGAQLFACAVRVTSAGGRRHTQQAIGGAAKRGDHDDRSTPIHALRLNGHLPGGADDRNQPLDGGTIGDRRAAEFHHNHLRKTFVGHWNFRHQASGIRHQASGISACH